MTLTIDKFGRVLIPKALRQYLMLEPGDEVEVEIDKDRPALLLAAKKEQEDAEIIYTDWGFPMIRTAGKFPDDFDTVEFLKETYEEYFDGKFGEK